MGMMADGYRGTYQGHAVELITISSPHAWQRTRANPFGIGVSREPDPSARGRRHECDR